jgi:hypothetical protein
MSIPLMAYFGHHKSGTRWIVKIIKSICSEAQIKYANFHSPKIFNSDLKTTILQKKLDFFSYTNADINYVRNLDNFQGFHVIRDPRDIVVSAYFSHLYSHSTDEWPELIEQRKRLESSSKNEGLLLTIEFLKHLKVAGVALNLFDSMYDWDYCLPNVREIKFEDLIANPSKNFSEIFQFLGIAEEYNAKILEEVQKNDFSVLSGGRKAGQEDLTNHYRNGVPGNWKNHFEKEHIKFFKENYNPLLLKLGYETTENW